MFGTEALIEQIGLLSYGGVWLLSFAANVFVPIPEEAILIILGYLAGGPRWNGLILLPVVLSGVLVSDILIYYLARRGNKFVTRAYNKLFASKVEARRDWITRHINKVIFFSRFIIHLRFLGPFLAGHLKVPFRKFLVLDFLALIIYVPFYLTLGWYFHGRINLILDGIGVVKNIVITVAIIALILYIMKLLRAKYTRIK